MQRHARQLGIYLLVPPAVVVLLPLVLLGVVALYVVALCQGCWMIARALIGKREPVEVAKPHFLEAQSSTQPFRKTVG